jgi:hypothetical protein
MSPTYSATTTLDTHRPSTYAPSPATCAKGAKAFLKFEVTDNLSPRAHMAFVIRKGTRTVETVTTTARTWEPLYVSFKCSLARGRYRFIVKARDLAGNRQKKTGSNFLTVT